VDKGVYSEPCHLRSGEYLVELLLIDVRFFHDSEANDTASPSRVMSRSRVPAFHVVRVSGPDANRRSQNARALAGSKLRLL
jgi:hypothetical protein